MILTTVIQMKKAFLFIVLKLYLIIQNIVVQVVKYDLVLYLDANNTYSYSGSGNTWNDLSGNNYHVSLNGPTFKSTS